MYKISIITPFHNVKEDLFNFAIESMLSQTIGFENIQWIVVVHNSQNQYFDYVNKRLGMYENVEIKVLKDDYHTPSSPRNYGLNFVKADYLGFLDADDGFCADCLEKALDCIRKEKAQVCTFRREFILEDEDAVPLDDLVLWNQLEEVIVQEDEGELMPLYSGMFGLVTSKIYDASFIKANNILFDLDIDMAEDYGYIMDVYHYAKRICFLPQYIGYRYFINGGSILQSKGKTYEQCLSAAKSAVKVLTKGKELGCFMDEMQVTLMVIVSMFVSNATLTTEQREEIAKITEPVILNYRMQTPSKIYSEQSVYFRYMMPRLVLLNPKMSMESIGKKLDDIAGFGNESKQPGTSILIEELKISRYSDIGRKKEFSEIHTLDDYKNRVSYSDYNDILPAINLCRTVGERYILSGRKTDAYLCGRNNREFPITKEQAFKDLELIERAIDFRRVFALSDSQLTMKKYNDGAYRYDFTSYYLKVLEERYQKRYVKSARDAEQVIVSSYNDVEGLKKYIEEGACRKLRQVLIFMALEDEDDIISKVKEIVSSDVEVFSPFWGDGWGVLGFRDSEDQDYTMCIHDGFYEFLAEDSNDAIIGNRLEPGKRYEVVVTNMSGLYRYRTGRTIEVSEVYDGMCKFR